MLKWKKSKSRKAESDYPFRYHYGLLDPKPVIDRTNAISPHIDLSNWMEKCMVPLS